MRNYTTAKEKSNNQFKYGLVAYGTDMNGELKNNFILAKIKDIENNNLNRYGVLWARSITKAVKEIKKLTYTNTKDNTIIWKGEKVKIIPLYKDNWTDKDKYNSPIWKYTFTKTLLI